MSLEDRVSQTITSDRYLSKCRRLLFAVDGMFYSRGFSNLCLFQIRVMAVNVQAVISFLPHSFSFYFLEYTGNRIDNNYLFVHTIGTYGTVHMILFYKATYGTVYYAIVVQYKRRYQKLQKG